MTAVEPGVEGQPAPGPHRPVAATPARRAGSVRRTTTVDSGWPDFDAGRVVVEVRGRDLLTAADGEATVLDEIGLRLSVDLATGRILHIDDNDLDGDDHGLVGIVGANLRGGFGRHLAGLLPDDGERRTLAYSALDDLPGAFLVSGYALLRAGVVGIDPDQIDAAAARQADICIGWATGSSMMVSLTERRRNPVPMGPVAPAVELGDPDGWHAVADLTPQAMRRRRQLDVWRDHDRSVRVLSHFRDSYAAEDHEMALHEYLVEATVVGGRIASITADPRSLPWVECPGAAASAQGVVGVALSEIGAKVRADLAGVTTCTHLNSTLRALADVQSLAANL
jgi:Protein of unknown function (DUF2889)